MLASIIVLAILVIVAGVFFVPSWVSNHNRRDPFDTGFSILAGFIILLNLVIGGLIIFVAYHFINKYW